MPAPRRPQQPQSLVQHLADQARRKPVNSTLSLSRYYMSADLLLRQVGCMGILEQHRMIAGSLQLSETLHVHYMDIGLAWPYAHTAG